VVLFWLFSPPIADLVDRHAEWCCWSVRPIEGGDFGDAVQKPSTTAQVRAAARRWPISAQTFADDQGRTKTVRAIARVTQ
jgi:hypothetical protein